MNYLKSDEEDGSPVEEISVDEVIDKVINKLWKDNNKLKDEELKKEETKKFVQDTLEDMNNEEEYKFDKEEFDSAFY